MTNDASKMYCVRPPPSDKREVTTSDGTRYRVEYIGNVDVVLTNHVVRCLVCTGLEIQYFSFHKVQQVHVIILDAVRAHIVGENPTFPSEKSGSCLRASRVTPGTVGAKARTKQALTSQISTSLSSYVSP